jgi:hypothetical protein
MGGPAHSLLYAYILFSTFTFFASQYVLHKTLNYNNSILWEKSYVPSLLATIFVIPFVLLNFSDEPWLNILIAEFAFGIIIFTICLSKNERTRLLHFINIRIKNIR